MEIWIAVPVLFLRSVHCGVSDKFTVVCVVLQDAELLPQNPINLFSAVIDFDVLEESLA